MISKTNPSRRAPWLAALVGIAALLLAACGAQTPTPATGPTATSPSGGGEPTRPPAPGPSMGPTELKYILLRKYAGNHNLLYCDPDLFPLQVSEEEELKRAEAKLPEIQADKEKYEAILRNNNLEGTATLSTDQKLLVYRDSKKLNVVTLEPAGDKYKFAIRAGKEANVNEGLGAKYEGLIDASGNITDEKQEDASVMCPICLAGDTVISTPNGLVRVRDMREGMPVWTLDKYGNRIAAPILKTARRAVPPPYEMVRLVLSDGRKLYVSPRHPLIDGRLIGSLETGDTLDSARIVEAKHVPYSEGATYDILPSGETGFYWADGILLASTLTTNLPGRR